MPKSSMVFKQNIDMRRPQTRRTLLASTAILILGILLSSFNVCQAAPALVEGQWFSDNGAMNREAFPIQKLPLTGGHFVFKGDFQITQAGEYVIDFKNTSTLGIFHHTITDAQGDLVAVLEGGIQSHAINPFPLRHARKLTLGVGQYSLTSSITTPYLIAQPTLYLDTSDHYQQAIKNSNLLAMVCIGILIGLGIYYAVLSTARRRITEAMYSLFILGNLLLQGTSLLVFSDQFDVHCFYMSSLPILFSNMAYILFVRSLLDIRLTNYPRLYRMSQIALGMMGIFVVLGMVHTNWMMEMARDGVAIFLCFGLICGGYLSTKGNITARFYLIAILVFFVLGAAAITANQLSSYTFYVEHLGLVAVTIEILLLALVLSYQFYALYQAKEQALTDLKISQQLAMTDSLTSLPNRLAMELAIQDLPKNGSLTFLDLDNLKYYNDYYGHHHGDALLRSFSQTLQSKLGNLATLHRLGGDEFAITCPTGDEVAIQSMLDETIAHIREHGFDFAGFSVGTAFMYENSANFNVLMHMADTRMYENKRSRKKRQWQQQFSNAY